jgi:hypothetical protein
MVAVVKLSCGTALMTSVGFSQLAAACQITAGPAAIALSPIAVAADVENFAASGGIAGLSTKDEFQGRRPFPKAGLDKAPRVMAGYDRLLVRGSFTELSDLAPIVTAVGALFSPPFVPAQHITTRQSIDSHHDCRTHFLRLKKKNPY